MPLVQAIKDFSKAVTLLCCYSAGALGVLLDSSCRYYEYESMLWQSPEPYSGYLALGAVAPYAWWPRLSNPAYAAVLRPACAFKGRWIWTAL